MCDGSGSAVAFAFCKVAAGTLAKAMFGPEWRTAGFDLVAVDLVPSADQVAGTKKAAPRGERGAVLA